jgi:TfoX/Sxy family transcriptional regulator of competence genes
MPYNEKLVERIREILKGKRGIIEVKMFGGLCFMHRGNMLAAVDKNDLIVRVGKENYQATLKKAHARPFDLTGRPLTGFVYVDKKGCATKAALEKWIDAGFSFAQSLPAKV